MAEHDVENRGSKNRGHNNNNDYSSSAYYEDKETMERGWTSWLIPLFVVANVAVFVVSMYINNCPKNNDFREGKCFARFLRRFSFQPLRENPLLGPSASTLDKLGGLVWLKVHRDEGWRLVTSMWLHAGVVHLAANMLCLIFIGIRLEQQFGFVRIGIIYLLSGFGGSILSTVFLRNNNVSVGASGALFGLLGAMLSELLTNWTIYTNKVAALLTLVFIIAINLAVGILPHVDNFAHIGGFLTGFFLGFILLLRPQFGWTERLNVPADVRVKSKHAAYQYVLWLASLALLIAGFAVGLVALFARVNGNDHCSWCHYLNCVSTSKWKCDD